MINLPPKSVSKASFQWCVDVYSNLFEALKPMLTTTRVLHNLTQFLAVLKKQIDKVKLSKIKSIVETLNYFVRLVQN